MLARLQNEYSKDVQVVYRHFPLISIHDKAALAAQASEAASDQGEFWNMHDVLFSHQSEWSSLTPEDFRLWVLDQAEVIGLDRQQFVVDLDKKEYVDLAQSAWDRGVEIGLPGTPLLLINHDIWPQDLPMSYSNIKTIIELTLLEQDQFSECPPLVIDPSKMYTATLNTGKGEIVIELFPDKAPIAVNNFVFLAREGWYDGVSFHRVLPGYIAQTGDPSGTGFGGPGYAFVNELSDLMFDRAGLVAMANAGPDSNGSQFFITSGPAEQLDGGYSIFGEVISGMEVVASLTPRNPADGFEQPDGDQIISITIREQ